MEFSHVVQFEYAKSAQEYLQRVGRLGQQGQVINFVRSEDMDLHEQIYSCISNDKSLADLFEKSNDDFGDLEDLSLKRKIY